MLITKQMLVGKKTQITVYPNLEEKMPFVSLSKNYRLHPYFAYKSLAHHIRW